MQDWTTHMAQYEDRGALQRVPRQLLQYWRATSTQFKNSLKTLSPPGCYIVYDVSIIVSSVCPTPTDMASHAIRLLSSVTPLLERQVARRFQNSVYLSTVYLITLPPVLTTTCSNCGRITECWIGRSLEVVIRPFYMLDVTKAFIFTKRSKT
jgi:hypothetical protein